MADHSQPGGGDDPWDLGPASGPGALSGVYSGQDPQADVADEHPFDRAEGQRYRDPQLIGWGGMGRVSTVTDTRLRREVALKEITLEGPQGGSL